MNTLTRNRYSTSRRCLPLLGALSALLAASCTVTATSPGPGVSTNVGDDASSSDDTGLGVSTDIDSGLAVDEAGNAGGLGFSPSNLGDALSSIDFSMLPDVDIKATDQLGLTPASYGVMQIMVTEAGGTTINVYIANSWKIEPTGLLNIVDHAPVVIVSATTIDVLGRIDATSSSNDTAVGGGFTSTGGLGGPGGGGSGMASDYPATDNSIGAGGGSFCGAGGAGGSAAGTQGAPGPTYGLPTLIPLQGGSAGGALPGLGGSGGGAIQLVAATSVTVGPAGIVSAGGGGGYGGGAAGGAGGGILIEAPTVTLAGTLAANGGGGGDGDSTGFGVDATPNATPAAGTSDAASGAGGDGSAGATITGAAGVAGGSDAPSGGGGGGAGYIRINTQSGTATLSGTLSPSAASACVTQGTLAP